MDAFVASRAPILEYARKPAISATASPKRKARELSDEDVEEPTSKRTRMSTRSSARRGAEATSAMAQQEADGPDHEEPADVYTPDDGLVACPICQSRMKEADINKHLDTSCAWKPSLPKTQPSTPKKATSQANLLTTQAKPSEQAKAPERLPALAYSMLKDQALRKKLMELGINSYGSRAHLERRHREWVTLWNANCDSSQPKTRNELLQDLDNWERTVGTGTRSLVYGHQAPQVKDKNFDGSAWASKHDDSFKDLIANARKSKQKAEDKAKESASPAPYPPQLVKAESSSDQQTSSTMVSMAERNAGGGFETEKAVLAERWQQPAPNLLPRSYGEFPYSTVADNDFVRNGRPGHEPEPTTEESAARIGSVTSSMPTPALSAGSNNRPDYAPQVSSYRSLSQPTIYENQGGHHHPWKEVTGTNSAVSNGALSAMVNNGFQLPPILHAANQPLRTGHLPAIADSGISSQPGSSSQQGVARLPSFSSSFNTYMARRSSQEPTPILSKQSPPR